MKQKGGKSGTWKSQRNPMRKEIANDGTWSTIAEDYDATKDTIEEEKGMDLPLRIAEGVPKKMVGSNEPAPVKTKPQGTQSSLYQKFRRTDLERSVKNRNT